MILPTYFLLEAETYLGGTPSWEKGKHVTIDRRSGKKKIRTHYKANDALMFIHEYAKRHVRRRLTERGFTSIDTAWNKGRGFKYHFLPHIKSSGAFDPYWFVTDIEAAFPSVDLKTLAQNLCSLFSINPNPYYDPNGVIYPYEINQHQLERFYQAIDDLLDPNTLHQDRKDLIKFALKMSDYMVFPSREYYEKVERLFQQFPPIARHQFRIDEMEWYLKRYFANPERKSGLGEGFSPSTLFFNVYCMYNLDARLHILCKKYDITYTRYGDDVFFTSLVPIGKVKRAKLKDAFYKSGFKIKDKKTRIFNLNKFGDSGVILNGVGIRNREGQAELFMPSYKKKSVKGSLYMTLAHDANISMERMQGLISDFKNNTVLAGRFEQSLSKDDELIMQLANAYRQNSQTFLREEHREDMVVSPESILPSPGTQLEFDW